jgi:hypothetical protein
MLLTTRSVSSDSPSLEISNYPLTSSCTTIYNDYFIYNQYILCDCGKGDEVKNCLIGISDTGCFAPIFSYSASTMR